eukprot:807569-Rhodomonas_salina.1
MRAAALKECCTKEVTAGFSCERCSLHVDRRPPARACPREDRSGLKARGSDRREKRCQRTRGEMRGGLCEGGVGEGKRRRRRRGGTRHVTADGPHLLAWLLVAQRHVVSAHQTECQLTLE